MFPEQFAVPSSAQLSALTTRRIIDNGKSPVKLFRQQRNRQSSRRGVAAAETAFCLPLILVLALGTVEISSGIFVKETLSIAAYEGARVGVKRRATNADAVAAVNVILTARGVNNPTITVSPSNFSTLSALQPITVTVSAPAANNCSYLNQYFSGRTITSTVKMVREFND